MWTIKTAVCRNTEKKEKKNTAGIDSPLVQSYFYALSNARPPYVSSICARNMSELFFGFTQDINCALKVFCLTHCILFPTLNHKWSVLIWKDLWVFCNRRDCAKYFRNVQTISDLNYNILKAYSNFLFCPNDTKSHSSFEFSNTDNTGAMKFKYRTKLVQTQWFVI